ncbi:MAG: hypothetical protein K2Q34_05445 [Alphaproteobacteria bacterium]|nr:hypothetical protein [Alphaproteobacteria bacterium]
MNTPVLTAIAAPYCLMGASWKATATNVCIFTIALLMLPDFVVLSSLIFANLQFGAIVLTYWDCHFMEVFLAKFKCKPTSMLMPLKGHLYVG